MNFRDDYFVVEKDDFPIKMNAEEILAELFNYGKNRLRSKSITVYIGGLDSI